MLDELNIRLRDLDGTRRQSVWHPGSTGSIGNTQSYQTPPSMQTSPGMPTPPGMHQQPTMPVQQTPHGLSHTHPVQHVSPPEYHQQPIGPASYNMASFAAGHATYPQQPQFQQSAYNFNQMPTPPQNAPFAVHQGNAHRPSQQFANWGGYGGVGGQPDTLDEENAVPPDTNPWNT